MKDRKSTLKDWHDFFSRHRRGGKSMDQIKHSLVHDYGYEKGTVDALGHHYTSKERKMRVSKISAAILIYIFVIASLFTYVYLKPSITGMVPFGFGRTFYVDASAGSDANSGLSASTPIKSIAKVNTLNLGPGDSVLFKRGETWRLPNDAYLSFRGGSVSGYVLYGAYGSGPKPALLGSNMSARASDWVSQGGNIWRYNHTMVFDVGNLAFGNGEFGWRNWSLGEISYAGQGHYYFDRSSNTLYLYSVANPVSHYGSIEVVFDNSVIEIWNKNYIIIENLSLKYSGEAGINTDSSNLVIRNNDISYIGGGFCFSGCNGNQRWGNGIQLWRGAHDVVIEGNKVWEIYDAALTQQGTAGTSYSAYNIAFKNNIVWNSEYGFEYFMDDADSSVVNMSVDHNTFYNMGVHWGHDQRINTVWARCVRSGNSVGTARNVRFTNNICYLAEQYVYGFMSDWVGWNSDLNLFMDYNLLYRDTSRGMSSNFAMWLPLGRSYSTFEEFRSATGKDQNSVSGNPQFTDVASFNFKPVEGSIACTLGQGGSYVGAIPCSTSAPANNAPTHSIPLLVASDAPLNTSAASLICQNISTADPDGNSVSNSFKWFRNSALVSSLTSDTVGPGTAAAGESWICQVTPHDGTIYGTAKNSSALVIRTAASGNGSSNATQNASIVACILSDSSWSEDSHVASAYDLSTCFVDPMGQSLTFSASGNSSIIVEIAANGNVTLSAPADWHGTEQVTFSVRAGSRLASARAVNLTVHPAPDCGDAVCDESESCNVCSQDCGECKKSRSGGGGGGGRVRGLALPQATNTTVTRPTPIVTATPIRTNTTVESTQVPIAQQGTPEPNVTEDLVREADQQVPTQVVTKSRYPGSVFMAFMVLLMTGAMYLGYRRITDYQREIALSNAASNPPESIESAAERYNVQLSAYVDAAAAKGYTRAQVKASLMGVGWPADVVDAFVQAADSKFKVASPVEAAVAQGIRPPSDTPKV